MKYGLLPKTMWAVFAPTFKKNLHIISAQNPNAIMKNAHARYREILNQVQEFDKGDNFILNILSAAMLAAVYLELDKKPNIEQLTEFYQCAMGNFVMRIYLKNTNPRSKQMPKKVIRETILTHGNSTLEQVKT